MWLNTRGARGARLAALACGWFAAWLITPAALWCVRSAVKWAVITPPPLA